MKIPNSGGWIPKLQKIPKEKKIPISGKKNPESQRMNPEITKKSRKNKKSRIPGKNFEITTKKSLIPEKNPERTKNPDFREKISKLLQKIPDSGKKSQKNKKSRFPGEIPNPGEKSRNYYKKSLITGKNPEITKNPDIT